MVRAKASYNGGDNNRVEVVVDRAVAANVVKLKADVEVVMASDVEKLRCRVARIWSR